MNDITLTKENWRESVLDAIAELPEDIFALVGWRDLSQDELVVSVAAPVLDDECAHADGAAFTNIASVRYFDRMEDIGDTRDRQALYVPGGPLHEQLDWPCVCVDSSSIGVRQAFYIGRSTMVDVGSQVQLAILEELYNSRDQFRDQNDEPLVCKASEIDDRYIRPDGTFILAWQERNGPNF